MVTRINDMPVYESRTETLDASIYNLWRRARLHVEMPLRIEMPELKQMALILEDDSWVVVDQCQYDLPILAWIEFQDSERSTLHTPVICTLNYYHYMASQIRGKVLLHMSKELESRLSHTEPARSNNPDTE